MQHDDWLDGLFLDKDELCIPNLEEVNNESWGYSLMPVLIIGWSIYEKLPEEEQKKFALV